MKKTTTRKKTTVKPGTGPTQLTDCALKPAPVTDPKDKRVRELEEKLYAANRAGADLQYKHDQQTRNCEALKAELRDVRAEQANRDRKQVETLLDVLKNISRNGGSPFANYPFGPR